MVHGNPPLTYKGKLRIGGVSCRKFTYDHGFPKSTGGSMLKKWANKIASVVKEVDINTLESHHKGSVSATFNIEVEHHGYLHRFCWYAISTVGIKAIFQEITNAKNEKSTTPTEQRYYLNLL